MADNNPPPPPQQQQQQAPSAAQHQQSSQQPAGGAQASGSAAAASNEVETYPCNWNGCVEIYKNAELLYDHVCEKHVGRKSTNNLELKCHWGNCTTTTVKRDHITSHIRVHIPLKPHKCEVCGKTFKRPQDLKKHVKTHAEDPNAMMRNAQEAGAASRPPPQNGGFTNMHPSQQMHGYPGYMPMPPGQGVPFGAYPPQGGNVGHYAPTQPGQHPPFPAGNGMPFYPQGGPHNGHHSMYQARGNGHEAVDALFGDIKNRAFDPNNFSEVTQRLMNLPSQLQFPGNSGAHNFGSHISNGGGGGGGVYAPAPAVLHSTAQFNNLRTKDEHLQAENYLAQMHQTIYESPASITAAGVGQPGAVPLPQHPHQHQHQQLQQQQHFKQRQSHSPPSAIPSSGHVEDMRSSDTPALTPGSSAMSVKSEQSPTSVHSNVVSPTNNNHPAYPMLPSSLDSPTARMALASTLGNQHDHDQRRRHSGSNLQRAQPDTSNFQVSTFAMDMDGAAPDQSAARSRSSKKKQAPSPDLNIDPALAGPGPAATGSSSTDSSDADGNVTPTNDDGGPALASWLHYVRTLENMLSIVREKLARKDYVEDEPETTTDGVFAKSEAAAHPAQQQHHQLLSNQGRQISFVQEGVKNEANKDVDANSNNGQVAYPELKME